MRPSWDEYFLELTVSIAERSTCLRKKVGAIIVKKKKILCTGYKGAPSGIENCLNTGCLRDEYDLEEGGRKEICRGLHAPQNAIVQGSLFGVQLEGGTMYVTHFPCIICMKMLINAGIGTIVVEGEELDAPQSEARRISLDMADYADLEIQFGRD